MVLKPNFLRLTGLCTALLMPVMAFAEENFNGINLLQPIGDTTQIPVTGNEGLGVFGFYFGLLYPWVVGMGAAIAVLMGVVGGIQIVQAGGDQAKVSAGKDRLLLSLGGLLIILFSAMLLNALNPFFFR